MCSPREDAIVHVKMKKICLKYIEKIQSCQAYLLHTDGTERETQCPSELGIFLLQVDEILLFLGKKARKTVMVQMIFNKGCKKGTKRHCSMVIWSYYKDIPAVASSEDCSFPSQSCLCPSESAGKSGYTVSSGPGASPKGIRHVGMIIFTTQLLKPQLHT